MWEWLIPGCLCVVGDGGGLYGGVDTGACIDKVAAGGGSGRDTTPKVGADTEADIVAWGALICDRMA